MNAYGVISLVRLMQPLSAVVWQLLAWAGEIYVYLVDLNRVLRATTRKKGRQLF